MMEGDTTMAARIDGKTSIEFEPRTLRMEQIQFAREAALYVLNTSSIEAALSIFTEGVEPVVGVARRNGDAINGMKMSKEKQYLENEDEDEDEDEDLQLPGIRDIASAPF